MIGIAAEGTGVGDHLEEMAVAGGRANPAPDHDDCPGEDPASLQAAFERVAVDVIACTLDLAQAPADAELFKISVDGVEYAYVAECGQGDGWTFVPDSMNLQIELCGAACLAFKGGATFSAKQYCLKAEARAVRGDRSRRDGAVAGGGGCHSVSIADAGPGASAWLCGPAIVGVTWCRERW